MNTIREVKKINEQELERGIAGTSASWHAQYAKSAWVYVGNLERELSEGDVICVLSQYGEVEDFNLIRDETTGESKGFGFCKYEDARSCVLAVDNLGGIELCGRALRVDHVENYKLPKHLMEKEEAARTLPGHAYADQELENEFSIAQGQDLFAKPERKSEKPEVDEKEAKRMRKEERRLKREEREQKKVEKEKRRAEREDRRKHKRSHRSKDDNGRERKKRKRDKRSRSVSPED